jgi:transcriptional regulator
MYPPKHFTLKSTNDLEKNNIIVNEQLIKLIEHNPLATLIFNQTAFNKHTGDLSTAQESTIIKSNTLNNTIDNTLLHISHIPCHFIQTEDNGSTDRGSKNINHQSPMLVLHVSNHHPLAKQLKANTEGEKIDKNTNKQESTSTKVSLVFHGEQGYISPNDIEAKDRAAHKVPTWNYSKVHVIADASEVFNRHEKYQLMEQSTDYFERSRDTPWLLTDAPERAIEQMLKAITFLKLSIIDIEAHFKS